MQSRTHDFFMNIPRYIISYIRGVDRRKCPHFLQNIYKIKPGKHDGLPSIHDAQYKTYVI